MAEIAGRPFMELLLRQIRRHGFSRIIMAVGYQKEAIRSHFGYETFGLRLTDPEETKPLSLAAPCGTPPYCWNRIPHW